MLRSFGSYLYFFRDDEQALLLLLQCGYSVEEALRRKRMNAGDFGDFSGDFGDSVQMLILI